MITAWAVSDQYCHKHPNSSAKMCQPTGVEPVLLSDMLGIDEERMDDVKWY